MLGLKAIAKRRCSSPSVPSLAPPALRALALADRGRSRGLSLGFAPDIGVRGFVFFDLAEDGVWTERGTASVALAAVASAGVNRFVPVGGWLEGAR